MLPVTIQITGALGRIGASEPDNPEVRAKYLNTLVKTDPSVRLVPKSRSKVPAIPSFQSMTAWPLVVLGPSPTEAGSHCPRANGSSHSHRQIWLASVRFSQTVP